MTDIRVKKIPGLTAPYYNLDEYYLSIANDQDLSPEQQRRAREAIGADLFGDMRNLLINPLGTINQRGYSSGSLTSSANQYTVDRWRVGSSGQGLPWTESNGVRTFTAPAGGVEQVVEGNAVLSVDYVLNWEGTATATVNGTSCMKGEAFPLAGGSDVTVRFSGGTFSLPQLERGVSPSAFAARHPQQELALCQRYFEKSYNVGTQPGAPSDRAGSERIRADSTNAAAARKTVKLRVFKRANPSITVYSVETGASGVVYRASGGGADVASAILFEGQGAFNAGALTGEVATFDFHWTADAEL